MDIGTAFDALVAVRKKLDALDRSSPEARTKFEYEDLQNQLRDGVKALVEKLQAPEIIERLIQIEISRSSKESETMTVNADGEIQRVKKQLGDLREKVELTGYESQKLAEEVRQLRSDLATTKRNVDPTPPSWLYPVILAAVIFLVGILVYAGWADHPKVAINYNVGEIIGGVLVGIGALLAGIAYATRRPERR